jgi:hypothetical protein
VEQSGGRAGRSFTSGLNCTSSVTGFGPELLGQASAGGLAAPDHPSVRALLRALMAAGPGALARGWRLGDRHAYTVERAGLEAVRVGLRAESAELAWREVTTVTPLAFDVLAVVLDRLSDGGREARLLRAAEILEAKGCRRWGVERCALEEQIGGELVRLGRFFLGTSHQPLFDVRPVGERRTSFLVTLDPELDEAWRAAPVRPLGGQIVQFDHRLNRGPDVLAKKLGLYFSLAGADGRPFIRSVRTILKGVGATPVPVCEARRRGRIADRFEEAVLRLQECGLFTIKYRGGDRLQDRVKGWVERWLDMELVVEPQPQTEPSRQVAFRTGARGAPDRRAMAQAPLA